MARAAKNEQSFKRKQRLVGDLRAVSAARIIISEVPRLRVLVAARTC
jgi:hypothetical protein